MLRVPYQYIESEVAPGLSFISRALGMGYAFCGITGLAMILRLGELTLGIGFFVGAIALFIISRLYNSSVEKRVKDIMENHPEKVLEVGYKKAIQNLTDSFAKKEISAADFSEQKKLLQEEMVAEIRKYKPDYNLGDTIRV